MPYGGSRPLNDHSPPALDRRAHPTSGCTHTELPTSIEKPVSRSPNIRNWRSRSTAWHPHADVSILCASCVTALREEGVGPCQPRREGMQPRPQLDQQNFFARVSREDRSGRQRTVEKILRLNSNAAGQRDSLIIRRSDLHQTTRGLKLPPPYKFILCTDRSSVRLSSSDLYRSRHLPMSP